MNTFNLNAKQLILENLSIQENSPLTAWDSILTYYTTHYDRMLRNIQTTKDFQVVDGILTAILDFFLAGLNNFKVILTRFYKAVKRSDAEAYIDSHRIAVKRVMSKPYTDVANILVIKPPFKPKPLDQLKNFQTFANQLYLIKPNFQPLIKIYKDAKEGVKNFDTSTIKNAITVINKFVDRNNTKKILQYLVKNTETRSEQLRVKFGDLFKSMKEFQQYVEEVVKLSNTVYNNAIKAKNALDDINKITDDMVKKLEKNKHLISSEKTAIKKLGEAVYSTAFFFDVMGSFIQELNHMDHNVMAILDDLTTKLT